MERREGYVAYGAVGGGGEETGEGQPAAAGK